MTTQQPEALRLADELCEAIAEYPEPTALEAQAAAELRRQHTRIAELEAQIEALSGVQALSAAPAGWKLVPVNPTPEMWKAAKSVPDPNPPYPPHYGLVWDAMLAASPTPPAEQQAAPKAAPGDVLDEALRERDEAEDFINELLDEVLGADRPEWSSAYNRYDAMSDVRERITALHKPAVDKAWGQFQSAMAAPQQEAQEAAPRESLDECFPGESRVAVPQGLISAACFAIRNKRDGGKVLEQLRRYSVGDLSQPLAPQQEAQEPTEIPEEIERMAADRYKVVPSHESMFHRWAVVAGTGTQQLYLGREVECQNMARKFAGAFLDGAFVAMQRTAPQPAPVAQGDAMNEVRRTVYAFAAPPTQEAPQQEPVAWRHSKTLCLYETKAEVPLADGDEWAEPLYLATPQPAPVAQGDAEDAARYRFLAGHCRSTSEHWGGRWSIIVDGPAPKSHDSEDDFDEAVDAARKQGGA